MVVYFCSFCKFIPCLNIVQPFIGLLRSKTQDVQRQGSPNPGLQHFTRQWPIRKWAAGRRTCVCAQVDWCEWGAGTHTQAAQLVVELRVHTHSLWAATQMSQAACEHVCTGLPLAWPGSPLPPPQLGCQTTKVGGHCSKTYSPNKTNLACVTKRVCYLIVLRENSLEVLARQSSLDLSYTPQGRHCLLNMRQMKVFTSRQPYGAVFLSLSF